MSVFVCVARGCGLQTSMNLGRLWWDVDDILMWCDFIEILRVMGHVLLTWDNVLLSPPFFVALFSLLYLLPFVFPPSFPFSFISSSFFSLCLFLFFFFLSVFSFFLSFLRLFSFPVLLSFFLFRPLLFFFLPFFSLSSSSSFFPGGDLWIRELQIRERIDLTLLVGGWRRIWIEFWYRKKEE